MEQHTDAGSVDLAGGKSATHHLHRALTEAQRRFAPAFDELDLDISDAAFKSTYPELLPRFEAARLASGRRAEIAASLVATGRESIAWVSGGDDHDLGDHVAAPAEPFELTVSAATTEGRLRPRVPLDGGWLEGDELVVAIRELVERGSATPAVAASIEWIVDAAGDDGVDLSDRRIVVLGANAELAPTRQWLEGGADVLWIDVADPPDDLLADDHPGSLSWVAGGADLLAHPERVRATIESFAAGEPVDLGLYAYAAGRAREWRLTAAMNVIVDALPTGTVRGVAMLVSPTTCAQLTQAELDGEQRRLENRPRWQSVLASMRALGRGSGHVGSGRASTKRAIVSIQGGSYQAAQYLGKLMVAERWATADAPLAVSANTAGISMTESLHHPVFDIAFSGAEALGVETFDPATTAHLNGLLTLRDRLDPAVSTDLDDLFATRVHGGITELPFPIEPALRVAATIGVAKDPRRIGGLIRR